MKNIAVILVVLLLITGCSPLHIHEDDSTSLKAAKVIARLPIALFSFGGSEYWHYKAREIESWVGKLDYQLIDSWGNPTNSYETWGGDKVLIYSFAAHYSVPGHAYTNTYGSAYAYGNSVYGNAHSYTTYTPGYSGSYDVWRKFTVNKYGIVTEATWNTIW